MKDNLCEVQKDPIKVESLRSRLKASSKLNESTGCIEWTGKAIANGGYGRMSCGRKYNFKAHRVAWFLSNGLIPDGLFVCHKCDNPLCLNIDHLFLGTQLENMKDMWSKGRESPTFRIKPEIVRGENNITSKLNNEKVIEIYSSYLSPKELSDIYGVSETHIYRIKKGDAWKHLTQGQKL